MQAAERDRSDSMRTVCYVGRFAFPDKDVAATRVLGIGRALRHAGFKVRFLGLENEGRSEDLQSNGQYTYDGFPYTPDTRRTRFGRFGSLWHVWRGYFTGGTTIARLRTQELPPGTLLIAYNAPALLLQRLLRAGRVNGWRIVADCTEWYDPRQFRLGRWGPFGWDSELRMRYLHRRCAGVIAISTYLATYYQTRGRHVLTVPPLIDLQEPVWLPLEAQRKEDYSLEFSYAGTVGKKDLVHNAIRALPMLGSSALRVRLVFLGSSRQQILAGLGSEANIVDKYPEAIHFLGRLPHAEALRRIASTDFTMMLRPNLRFANAGFPTKLVESLALGVPMIGNLTSDIGMYVRDGREGLLLPDCSPGAFAAGVQRALALTPEERESMRTAARRCAEASFDYRRWSAPAADFMRRVIGRTANAAEA